MISALKCGTQSNILEMLAAFRLPVYEFGSWWTICPYAGSLLRHKIKPLSARFLPIRLKEVVRICDDPFSCRWNSNSSNASPSIKSVQLQSIIYNRLLKLGNNRFLLSRLYAGIRCPIFKNTEDAISSLEFETDYVENGNFRCLQRAFFAAKTSQSFPRSGVILIGANIQTFAMHAWIIEDGTQPDHGDRDWINYRPLLALLHRP